MSATDATTESFLNANRVMARYGVSHMFLVRRLADDPTFPRPVYLGRLRFWKLANLERWEREQAAKPAPAPIGFKPKVKSKRRAA